jgi:hypothetical protein
VKGDYPANTPQIPQDAGAPPGYRTGLYNRCQSLHMISSLIVSITRKVLLSSNSTSCSVSSRELYKLRRPKWLKPRSESWPRRHFLSARRQPPGAPG